MEYKPLPDFLTIKSSPINGLGLFALSDIENSTELGISHYKLYNKHLIRTPLGGFYNHSDDPNCMKIILHTGPHITYTLITIRDIVAGEELTCKYTFYDVGE